MSFAQTAPSAGVVQLKSTLQDNARVFAIGVSRYDAFPDAPVRSATQNALAWLLQALRMGSSPYWNPLSVEEADQPELLAERLHDTLASADLSAAEREGLSALLQAASGQQSGWRTSRPLLGELIHDLVILGNHLEYNPRCRLLVTFSGHGALSRGQLVLCAADARRVSQEPSYAELSARRGALVNTLEARGRSQGGGQVWDDAVRLIQSMWRLARTRGVLPELLDVLAVPVAVMGLRYRCEVIVELLRFTARNLRRVPDQGRRLAPDFEGALTPIHFMLALGRHDRRCTLVLDACHSGGPGEALQGSMAGHDWLRAGMGARILSSSQGAQRSAETRVGERRFSVATWALTQVLSRWEPVEDGVAYAMGIRNGELVLRANLLLQALSFQQHLSLHAPPPRSGQPSAADMPFCGLAPGTRTTVDPQTASGGIQLGSDTDSLTCWKVELGGTLKAVLLAVGSGAPSWTHSFTPAGGVSLSRTYTANKLYVFTTPAFVGQLADCGGFVVKMHSWDGSGSPPPTFTGPINSFGNTPAQQVLAVGDPGEQAYGGPSDPSGVFAFQASPSAKKVFLRWVKPMGGDKGKLHFISEVAFPYLPGDFGSGAMSFDPVSSPGFDSSCVEHLIGL